MQERILDKLILENEEYIFVGNLTINGDIIMKNSNLIVSGTLSFSKIHANISIINCNISANEFKSVTSITIHSTDIYVNFLDFDDIKYSFNIISDGNIEVRKDSYIGNVICLNYFVNGNNNSNCITAIEDIYILGNNDSYNITARDVFICGNCELNDYTLISKALFCPEGISHCSYLAVG